MNSLKKEPHSTAHTDGLLCMAVPLTHPWQFWPNPYWFPGLYTSVPIINYSKVNMDCDLS